MFVSVLYEMVNHVKDPAAVKMANNKIIGLTKSMRRVLYKRAVIPSDHEVVICLTYHIYNVCHILRAAPIPPVGNLSPIFDRVEHRPFCGCLLKFADNGFGRSGPKHITWGQEGSWQHSPLVSFVRLENHNEQYSKLHDRRGFGASSNKSKIETK